ncbi:MAG TPA: hypothetical protein ENG87_00210 [Candidatus Pacearchaeota archaeon]|nr:peptidase C39 family protein [archaeon BMS3Abin17]HDK41772.1 hypothetical protein [Candidatus Pacearchaeota archaeon]HDZ61000.1 hypothetical protein [Candidatus Pacearchaeota archaeon]
MKLKVPVLEAKNRLGCGPTSLSMILNYYRKNYSEKQVIDNLEIGLIKKEDLGARAVDLALLAKKFGFDVICYSYNMELYRPSFSRLSKPGLISEIKKLLQKKHSASNKAVLKTTIKLLENNADFKIKMPSIDDIIKFLKKGIPVILAVNAKILFEVEKLQGFPKIPNNMGHFIVLTGFVDDIFYYNCPYYGESKKISKDKLFFALSNNILDSSAYLIAVKS